MRDEIVQALSKSAADFRDKVWPLISEGCGGGELVPVESVTEAHFARELDTLAGVDAWQVHKPHGMRGIASRVQWVDNPYNTFTIRAEVVSGYATELQKRWTAIKHGYLYPHFTVQAYLSRDRKDVLAVGLTHTRELYTVATEWVERYADVGDEDLWRYREGVCVKTAPDGNRFLAMAWEPYRMSGHWLYIYQPNPDTWVVA